MPTYNSELRFGVCCKMSLIIELFTSNSLRSRAFRIFPFLMLGLCGLEYLFTEKVENNISAPSGPPKVLISVANMEKTWEIITQSLTSEPARIMTIESICLQNNNSPKHKTKKKYKQDKKKYNSKQNADEIKFCDTPSNLGPVEVNLTKITLENVDMKYPSIEWGGFYSPRNCKASNKVAIIIPYRDRRDHLALLINHLHPFLMQQQIIEYGIFVIEQFGVNHFNRGKLMNIGAMETNNYYLGDWDCYIFHDVDLLPQNTKNIYSCPSWPRHMSPAVDVYSYKLKYENAFGGVISINRKQFMHVNGFSNNFWGWGGEDDDMFNRLQHCNYSITRYKLDIARYTMLAHAKPEPNSMRYDIMQSMGKNYKADGLTNLSYKIINTCRNHLFTRILVDIDLPAI